MWEISSHMLAPLTNIISSKVKFKGSKIKQEYFELINNIMACNTLSVYPDFHDEFKFRTKAKKFQLGA